MEDAGAVFSLRSLFRCKENGNLSMNEPTETRTSTTNCTAPTAAEAVPVARPAGNGNGNASRAAGNGNGAFSAPATPRVPWSIAEAARNYGIAQWGQGYFSINEEGNVSVHPMQKPEASVDLKKLVDELRERDIQLPMLIRFTAIPKHRVGQIHDAFDKAIRENEYKGAYRCVYPIKVNQQRHVVEEILDIGKPYHFGLEAGSKPELLAVRALVAADEPPLISTCFKDNKSLGG